MPRRIITYSDLRGLKAWDIKCDKKDAEDLISQIMENQESLNRVENYLTNPNQEFDNHTGSIVAGTTLEILRDWKK